MVLLGTLIAGVIPCKKLYTYARGQDIFTKDYMRRQSVFFYSQQVENEFVVGFQENGCFL